MPAIDTIVNTIQEIPYDSIEISILLQQISRDVRLRNNFSSGYCKLLHYMFSLIKHYNIDIDNAWNHWHLKATHKKYN